VQFSKMFRWKNSSQTEQEQKEAALREAKVKYFKALLMIFISLNYLVDS